MKTTGRFMLIMVWAIIASLLIPSHALAMFQGPSVIGLQQRDLDGDGSPDVTIIHCAFATDSDTVYVYDGAGDMQTAPDWHEATDFVNDTWVFDVGSDGSAQVIIRFTEESGPLTALFYDDRDGDGQVAFKATGKRILIQEPGTWSLKVVSDGAWFLPDGYPNQNLRFFFFAGNEDIVSGVVDSGHSGVPDYEYWNAVARQSSAIAPYQPGLWVNKGTTRPAVPDDVLFWPFLIAGDRPKIQNKFDRTPYVTVDWEQAVIQSSSIGKDVSGYPIEAGYFVLPLSPLTLGELNYINFENPMAYYDMAADQDGRPELHVRMEYYGPSDDYWATIRSPRARNDIRYSWNQRNSPNLSWDFKLALAGDNPVNSAVQFADLGIKTVPYEVLPTWIAEQTWAWGSLVASERDGYRSSEGIYEWGATYNFQADFSDVNTRVPGSGMALVQYLTGASVERPDHFFNSIRPHFRGEFAYLEDRPFLYLSPLDRKLHLKHALHGIWNTGGESEIRMANRNGDAYLDEWSFYRGGSLRRQLSLIGDFLILSDSEVGSIEIKRAKVGSALFESSPPGDHAEWLALGEQLEEHRRDFAPDDFAGMVAQFDGPTTEIQGAAIRDLRATSRGFRFVLDLQPGFSVPLDQVSLGAWLGTPGSHVVEYDGSAWSVKPATPPSLRVGDLQVNAQGSELSALDWTTVETLVRNDGLEDVHDVPVCAAFDGPAEQHIVMTDTVALLPGEGQQHLAWDWAPPAAGSWNVQVAAYCDGSEEGMSGGQVLGETTVEVSGIAGPSPGWLISLGGMVSPIAALFLVVAAMIAGSAAIIWFKEVTR